jgi:hypothetical protein
MTSTDVVRIADLFRYSRIGDTAAFQHRLKHPSQGIRAAVQAGT